MAVRFYDYRGTTFGMLIIFFIVSVGCVIAGRPPTSSAWTVPELDNSQRNGPVPKCENATFCDETPYYPLDYVNSILAMNQHFMHLATVDEEPISVQKRIISFEDGDPLCSSKEKQVKPKTGLARNSEWLYIANTPTFVQMLRVEVCTSENNVCNIIDGFADGYVTKCKQMYIYRELVAVTRMGELAKEFFRIPSSCKCFVKFTGNPYTRMGVSLGKGKPRNPITKIKIH